MIAFRAFVLYAAAGIACTTTARARKLTGSEFLRHVASLSERQRELAIRSELLNGGMAPFLRNLVPVNLKSGNLTATVFVAPEYLAIGSNDDFLRVPMNLYSASAVAVRMGFVLPTRKIADAIYRQAGAHLSPEPMTPGPQMRSTDYYRIHNQTIEMQSRQTTIVPGELISGHKKDVVVTPLLASNPGRIAIYGWHRPDGSPIQPLSTVHGACYADYSRGIRLVSEQVVVNGERKSIYDVLADPRLAAVLSDEGPIPGLREFLARAGETVCTETGTARASDIASALISRP